MKLFIILFILTTFLFSQENKNLKIEESSTYIKAVALYNIANFEKSYSRFYKLFKTNLENKNINYYLALNAIKLKKYNLAIAALERILISNPNDFESKYQLCNVNFLMGNYSLAHELSLALQKDLVSAEKKKKIENLIASINKKRKSYSLEGFFLLGTQSSDNVNSGVSKKYLLPDFFNNIPQGNSTKSDNSLMYMLSLNAKFFDIKNPKLKFENEFLYFNKLFSSEKEENFEFYSYSPMVSYLLSDSKIYTGFILGRYKPGYDTSKDNFDTFGIKSKYLTNDYSLELKAQRFFYRNNDFKDKNYTRYETSYKLFDINKFNIEFTFLNDEAFHSNRTDLNKTSFKSLLEYSYDLNGILKITPSFSYRYTKYKDESIAFKTKRKDNYYSWFLSMKKTYNRTNIFDLMFEYVKNDSNHAEYDYNSKNVTFYYIKLFSL